MKLFVIVCTVLVLLSPTLAAADTAVVRVLKASIKESPSIQARTVAEARRGDKLEVVKKEGSWYMVRLPDARTGWVFEYSVDTVKQATKEEDLFGEIEGPSRIEVAEATSASAIRGLSQPARVYAKNHDLQERYVRAVEEMGAYSVTQDEVDRFLREEQVGRK